MVEEMLFFFPKTGQKVDNLKCDYLSTEVFIHEVMCLNGVNNVN